MGLPLVGDPGEQLQGVVLNPPTSRQEDIATAQNVDEASVDHYFPIPLAEEKLGAPKQVHTGHLLAAGIQFSLGAAEDAHVGTPAQGQVDNRADCYQNCAGGQGSRPEWG